MNTRTRSEAREWFKRSGITVTEWSTEHGFERELVYAVLSGRVLGQHGRAHKVALALKIKSLPHTEDEV